MAKRQMKRLYYGRIKVPARLAKSEEQVFVAGDSYVNLYRGSMGYRVAVHLQADQSQMSWYTVEPTYREACLALHNYACALDRQFGDLAEVLFSCFENEEN